MKALTIALKIAWTGATFALVWSLVTTADPYLPKWAVVTDAGLIVFVWAVIMLRLSALVPSLYAIAWLVLIFFGAGVIMASIVVGAGNYAPDWTVVPFFAFVVAVWLIVLRRRVSLKWPVTAAVVLFCLPSGVLVSGIVGAIGIGKLVIQSVGRANVYAPSRIRAGHPRVSPRGLVE
jgi:hypothetical protein